MGRHQINIVHLSEDERKFLDKFTKSGPGRAREVQRAKILLLADFNGPIAMQDSQIAKHLGCSIGTVLYRRRRFAETRSIEDTLFDSPRTGRPTIVDGAVEAHITKIACSHSPDGYATWSLNLIRDKVVSLDIIDNISRSTVRRVLKKNNQALAKKRVENSS